jgi:hypothetical protein
VEIINWDVLGAVLIGSAIVAKLLNAIKALAGSYYAELSDKRKELCGMGVVVVGAGLMALTGLDALPGFSAVVPWAGRLLTCFIAGFGPGLVYDVAMDRPAPLVPP